MHPTPFPSAAGGITIGALAGALEALQRFIRELPHDLVAAVCLVLHVPASSRDLPGELIDRRTPLPVATAVDGATLRAGHVCVAPPDCHPRVDGGRVPLDRGPGGNGVPAIDDDAGEDIAAEAS